MMSQTRNPAFFVVGCPRSGTRLLGRLLDAHPLLCIGPECHRLVELLSRGDSLNMPVYEGWDYTQYNAVLTAAKVSGQNLSIPELANHCLDQFAAEQGKIFAGHKLATRVCEPLLYRTWPSTRFIHEYRDGRSVFCSVRKWQWIEEELIRRLPSYLTDPEATVAGWWKWHIVRRQTFGRMPEVNWLEISYESLIANPQRVLNVICQFLQIEYDERMLFFHKKNAVSDALNVGEDWKRPITAGLRQWEKELTSEEVARFQAGAGNLLEQLGYSLAPVELPSSEEERLQSISHAAVVSMEKEAVERGWGQCLPLGDSQL